MTEASIRKSVELIHIIDELSHTRMNETKKPMTAMPTRAPAIPPTIEPTFTPEEEEGAALADGETVLTPPPVMERREGVAKELVATTPGAVRTKVRVD